MTRETRHGNGAGGNGNGGFGGGFDDFDDFIRDREADAGRGWDDPEDPYEGFGRSKERSGSRPRQPGIDRALIESITRLP